MSKFNLRRGGPQIVGSLKGMYLVHSFFFYINDLKSVTSCELLFMQMTLQYWLLIMTKTWLKVILSSELLYELKRSLGFNVVVGDTACS